MLHDASDIVNLNCRRSNIRHCCYKHWMGNECLSVHLYQFVHCILEVDRVSALASVSVPNVVNLWLSADIRLWPNASLNFQRGFRIRPVFWSKPKVEPKVESTTAKCELSCGCAVHIVHSSTSVVTSTAAAASACETCTDWESPISTTWKFCAKVSVSTTNQHGQRAVV